MLAVVSRRVKHCEMGQCACSRSPVKRIDEIITARLRVKRSEDCWIIEFEYSNSRVYFGGQFTLSGQWIEGFVLISWRQFKDHVNLRLIKTHKLRRRGSPYYTRLSMNYYLVRVIVTQSNPVKLNFSFVPERFSIKNHLTYYLVSNYFKLTLVAYVQTAKPSRAGWWRMSTFQPFWPGLLKCSNIIINFVVGPFPYSNAAPNDSGTLLRVATTPPKSVRLHPSLRLSPIRLTHNLLNAGHEYMVANVRQAKSRGIWRV